MPTSTPQLLESLIALRRDLHAHPELRFAETRTAGIVADRLRGARLEVTEGVAGTGVVATLGTSGPHVLVRADLDALPTPDAKEAGYRSTAHGVSHACGHDVHTTVVLGVAETLAAAPPAEGRITFVFQPAEEIPFGEASGGQAMLDAGVLDGVDLVLGLHCWPWLPAGVVGVDQRVAMAGKSAFKVAVTGVGAHAAAPDQGRDAIVAVSHMVTGLHQLLSRETRPGQRATINVGTILGGRSQSIVPPSAELTGTIRSADPELGRRLQDSLERWVRGVSTAVGVQSRVEWRNEMPPVLNDPTLVQRALEVLEGQAALEVRLLDDPPMTADDFALYAQSRPGLYLKLGVCAPDGSVGAYPLHDSRFDVDEAAIGVGVSALTALVEDLLQRPPEASRG
ncbi:MAG TPA: amidohydrolase [Intrasporangium sp.]|uniref:M20 metallopeptidase family protein n=1 Tax=Intrasporangium sp. TaxID=1925024 RepID=UPI002D780629|nr:amidohydrolase [Intrasporangium sp.]HET7397385.1 amidohydrolase [Intrasporangium sp.]